MKMLRRKGGFTLVEIMIVVAIIGLLAAIAIPNFMAARRNAQTQACISNLRQVEGAKVLWYLDGQSGDPDMAGLVTNDYLVAAVTCPLGGDYTMNDDASPVACPNYDADSHDASLT